MTQPILELEVGLKKYYPTANFQPIELSAMSYRLLQAASHTNSADTSQSTKNDPKRECLLHMWDLESDLRSV